MAQLLRFKNVGTSELVLDTPDGPQSMMPGDEGHLSIPSGLLQFYLDIGALAPVGPAPLMEAAPEGDETGEEEGEA